MSSRASKNKALVVLNAHHLRRQLTDLPVPIDPRELNATLVIWLPGWLDELSDDLTGRQGYSATHLAAMKRCLAAIEAHTAIKFDQYIYTSEGLDMDKLLETKVDAPRSKVKPVKVRATNQASAVSKAVVNAVKHVDPVVTSPITKNTGKVPKKLQKKTHGRKAPADAGYRIKVLVEGNPKRDKTSHAYRYFEMYRRCKTVGEYLAKGGSRAYLKYDEKQGYVALVKA